MAITKITADVIDTGTITADNLHATLDLSSKTLTMPTAQITADNLHSTLDLSSKTLTLPTAQTATTQSAGDNSTKVATTAYVETATAALVDSAPGTLNTLNELAAALGDDANFSTTVTNSIAAKLPLAGGNITGDLTVDTDTLFVDVSADRVGIGTSSPSSILDINANAPIITIESASTQNSKILFVEDGSNAVSLFYEGSAGAGTDNNLHIRSELSGSETNLVTFGLDGNVGIGQTSPSTKLSITAGSANGIELDQDSDLATDSARLFFNSSSGGYSIFNTSGNLRFSSGATAGSSSGTERMRIDSSGNVDLYQGNNLTWRYAAGSTIRGSISVSSADVMTFNNGSSNTERMRIDGSGNVGIGTTSPVSAGSGAKSLHVSAVGEARLVLSGDNNNSGDTGQLDAAIYMLTDGGVGTDPFGVTSSTNAGAHGYSFRANNYSGDSTFTMVEESDGTASNLIHVDTSGNVVIGFGSTSVAAGAKFQVDSTTSMVIPKGTTAQRPGSAVSGAMRFNTTTSSGEFYNGSTWKAIGYGSYEAEWLVVAGGGSGGDCTSPARHAGGGGAGGLRTSFGSTSGGGASAEANMTVNSGTVYTITVGAGGASIGNSHNTAGNSGSNSSIAGTGMTTITSLGGGGGGGNEVDGSSGGSGGGGKESSGAGQAGTAGQGYAGGSGSESADRGGGGGGAGAAGGTTDGGAGLAVSITGSSVTYAGGGASSGSGGAGGGGNHSSAGTANTGGGGGSAGSISGAGGSGVVILRMATSDYSGVTTGSPTVTTTGTDTVIKFTSSGTYTG